MSSDTAVAELQSTFTRVEMELITSSILAAGLGARRVPIQVGASLTAIDSLRKSRSIILRWPLFGLTESLEIDPRVVALATPFVFPDAALRLSFVNADAMSGATYCMLPDATVRVVITESGVSLTPLLTRDVMIALRGDLPLAPRALATRTGREVDYSIVAAAGELSMGGNRQEAIAELVKAGVPAAVGAEYVEALSAPASFGVAFNGTTGVAWLQGADGGPIWWGPMADSQENDSIYVGEINSTDVLIGIGRLLPGGPGWDDILYPLRDAEGPGMVLVES